jgi:hypothetical protein
VTAAAAKPAVVVVWNQAQPATPIWRCRVPTRDLLLASWLGGSRKPGEPEFAGLSPPGERRFVLLALQAGTLWAPSGVTSTIGPGSAAGLSQRGDHSDRRSEEAWGRPSTAQTACRCAAANRI